MKIAVVGCGAVGSYYGAKLIQAGHEVWFLLRSDYEVVRRQGVQVRSPCGDFHVHPCCARLPEEIGPCDWVVIALKATANHEFARLLPPLVGPHTALLTLQNGLGNEAELAALFGAERVLGGLCFVCLNRVAPGLIHHIDHGQIVMGEYLRRPERRTRECAALFRSVGVPCEVAEDLERAHWDKLVWNIPFNGLGVASAAGYGAVVRGELAEDPPLGPCLTTEQLLSVPEWENLIRELMREVIGTAQHLGFNSSFDLIELNIARTRTMGGYKASTVIDFEHGRPIELKSLFLEPLRCAQSAAVETPRLSALCRVLAQLDERRGAANSRAQETTPPPRRRQSSSSSAS